MSESTDQPDNGSPAAIPPASSAEDSSPSLIRLLAGAALLGFTFMLLPLWDALDRHSMMSALAGSGLGASSNVPMPTGIFLYPGLGVSLAVIAWRRARADRGTKILVLCAAVWIGYYAISTAYRTACKRSHAIDFWNVCEEPGRSPLGFGTFVSDYKRPPMFEGPHLDNGDPCVHQSEQRDVHIKEHPDGNLIDGLVQIKNRFPNDRLRVFGGTLVTMIGLAVAALLLLRRSRASTPQQPSST
jgi:hypothetical protein